MRNILLVVGLLTSGCASAEFEKPLTEKERSELLAALPAKDREAFGTLIWAREVDQRPIMADFNTCIEREVGQGDPTLPPSAVAIAVADSCFPIVKRLARGIAMRLPALMTGATGDDLNNWADDQAAEQKAELISAVATRVEEARLSASSAATELPSPFPTSMPPSETRR